MGLCTYPAVAQDTATTPHGVGAWGDVLYVTRYSTVEEGSVRLTMEPLSHALVYMRTNGEIRIANEGMPSMLLYSAADHGLSSTTGMAFGPDGALYLVGMEVQGNYNVATIKRGVMFPGGEWSRIWTTVARTVPYPRSNTNFDHNFNGIVVSPDGRSLYVNSGSRTDHGEVQDAGGAFPGLREVPLTSAIFRLPADGSDIELRNDEEWLRTNGYLYADGVRNSFSLAFDATGALYATENSGDRDDNDEINRIQEGHHYGFPWRMGMRDNPQQFPGYDTAADRLINRASYAYTQGTFHNDPTFPPPPAGVTFTDPLSNVGPQGARYRDPADGTIREGSRENPVGTLTPHRSPLGLLFGGGDGAGRIGDFVLGWTSSRPTSGSLLVPFGEDEGEDLLLITPDSGTTTISTQRVVSGFNQPIDMQSYGTSLYVMDFAGDRAIWRIGGLSVGVENEGTASAPFRFVGSYPNPFSSSTRFSLAMAQPGRLRLDVVNAMGEPVVSLFDGRLPEGISPTFIFDGTGLPNGVYSIRARGDDFAKVHRVVLMK